MRKRTNALRKIYQRTLNNEELRENNNNKKKVYRREKEKETKNEKERESKLMEYCNTTSPGNPWNEAYKLASGKTRNAVKLTTLQCMYVCMSFNGILFISTLTKCLRILNVISRLSLFHLTSPLSFSLSLSLTHTHTHTQRLVTRQMQFWFTGSKVCSSCRYVHDLYVGLYYI